MKIIFLDMDGVLCTYRSHIAQGLDPTIWHMAALDREGVALLNRLADTHDDIKYVLSSTWRIHYDQEWMTNYLRKFGWTGEFHEDWKTPELHKMRGVEIEDWLNRHEGEWETYVILDDNADMLDEQAPHFVQTDIDDGISLRNYQHIENILAGNT